MVGGARHAAPRNRTDAEAVGDDYTRWREMEFRPELYEQVFAAVPAGCRIAVDAGCGSGFFAARLAATAQGVVAFDTSWTMLRRVRRRLAADGPGNVFPVLADMCRPPLREGAADFVLSINALHHVPLEEGLAALSSLVAPGGGFAIRDLVHPFPRLAESLPYKLYTSARRFLGVVRRHGIGRCFGLAAFLFSREWLTPEARLKLTPVDFARRCAALLPGCVVEPQGRTAATVVWQRPLPG